MILILFKQNIIKLSHGSLKRDSSIPEVALISGHKDVRMLFRYTHLKAEDILMKL